MKLCRFEVVAEPGQPRSGFAFQGKVYETDGQQPIAIHEPADVRLLAPILPGSIRFYYDQSGEYVYLNPASIVGPGEPVLGMLQVPMVMQPCLVAIAASHARNVAPELGDELLLGLSLGALFYRGDGSTASMRDAGFALGPAITTPDELEAVVEETEDGRRYKIQIGSGRAGQDAAMADNSSWPWTLAQLITTASNSCALRPGDLFAIAAGIPVGPIEQGDEVQVASEHMGVLRNRIQ
jgi:hypothetical protein